METIDMEPVRIAIVVASVRQGRQGERVGKWFHAIASGRADAAFELIDLKDFRSCPALRASSSERRRFRQFS